MNKARPLPPEIVRNKRDVDNTWEQLDYIEVHQAAVFKQLEATPQAVLGFMNAFLQGLPGAAGRRVEVDDTDIEKLMQQYGISEMDGVWVSVYLRRGERGAYKAQEGRAYQGQVLLYSLSAAGYPEATIRIMRNACLAAQKEPAVLRNMRIPAVRKHLRMLAEEGGNVRAMVLEGKTSLLLGDWDRAIEFLERAKLLAIEESEVEKGDKPGEIQSIVSKLNDLTTPWIELTILYDRRGDVANKEEAIQTGMDQDDPTSFYWAAEFYKRHDDGQHIPTSDWLYYMTKAAASGIPKAAYELGIFYRDSGWKYVEDEPPDHVKPTPFDSFPPNLLGRTKRLLGLRNTESTTEKREKRKRAIEDMFHAAMFPSTAAERQAFALYWLNVAQQWSYAPSELALAKLYMEKSLWPMADAPKEALTLSDKRYAYANETEYEDAKFMGELNTYQPPYIPEHLWPANPFLNHDKAKEHLCNIFIAYRSSNTRKKKYGRAGRAGSLVPNTEFETESIFDDIDDASIDIPEAEKRYLRFPEVFDMWKDEAENLHKQAIAICEREKWDIYAEDKTLIWKSGISTPRTTIR